MLKEAIEKIQELVESRNKVQTIDIEGTTYTELALSPIKERIPVIAWISAISKC